jgi:PilZ domain
MSTTVLPPVNSLVKIQFDGQEYASRVEDTAGGRLVVAAPQGGTAETPREGETVTLVWSAGARGRYTAEIHLLTVQRGHLPLWTVELVGAPRIEQRRQFVRAGGGETVRLRPPEPGRLSQSQCPISKAMDGRVLNISEGGIRVSLVECELEPGQLATVTIELGHERVVADAVVREILEPERDRTTAVMTFESPTEQGAALLRRYVMHRQLAARNGSG